MEKIRVLSAALANQIAAGEVVERPASVVKELVENALDAHSTKIHIALEEGGLTLVRVRDDGDGMAKGDVTRAFMRHATSKIAHAKDLFNIRSLGFRGEALPSIASVSQLQCRTKAVDEVVGTQVVIHGGNSEKVEDVACPQGTDIEVRHLFYNTPARLKYLKTVNTEISHVVNAVNRLALAYPEVSFRLEHDGRTLLHTLGDGRLLHVIQAIYGQTVARAMLGIHAEHLDFSLDGFICKPEVTRASRHYMTTLVNGRYVRSYALTQAIIEAYHTLLPINRLPLAVLNIHMDPRLIDVNVHPTKLEVRFSKEKTLAEWLTQTIKERLMEESLIPQLRFDTSAPRQQKSVQTEFQFTHEAIKEQHPHFAADARPVNGNASRQRPTSARPDINPREGTGTSVPRASGRPTAATDSESSRANRKEWGETRTEEDRAQTENHAQTENDAQTENLAQTENHVRQATSDDVNDQHAERATSHTQSYSAATQTGDTSDAPASAVQSAQRLPDLTPLAQVHGTYIVAQSADSLYLIDQHAAHERVYYEYFRRRLANEDRRLQELLFPLQLELTADESAVLHEKRSLLEAVGVVLEPFGEKTFIVRSHPTWFPQGHEEALIREIVDWVLEHRRLSLADLRDESAAQLACKAAIKANRHLRQDEMDSLLTQLQRAANPFTCPHGRPVLIQFTAYELEKLFKRVM